MNGASACCNSNSYAEERVAATLPWLFQAARAVAGTHLIGER
jgi:hypothetical protein